MRRKKGITSKKEIGKFKNSSSDFQTKLKRKKNTYCVQNFNQSENLKFLICNKEFLKNAIKN